MKDLQIENKNNLRLMDSNTLPAELLDRIDGFTALLSLEPLEESQILVIANFLFTEFKTMTIESIHDAVIKAVSGKLNKYGDAVAYGKIDIEYFGRVLPLYKKFQADEVLRQRAKRVAPPENQKLLGVNRKEMRKQERKEWYEWICKVIDEEGKLPLIANWSDCFEHLWSLKLISLSDDEIEMFKELEVENIKDEIAYRKFNNKLFGDLMDILRDDVNLNLHCRTKLTKNYFENEYKK